MSGDKPPVLHTPDRRYIIVKGRLWRATNPSLSDNERNAAVSDLMTARRAVRDAASDNEIAQARKRVDATKHRLGERGPVWWSDGTPDYNRHQVENSPYADWWQSQIAKERHR